MWNFPCFVVGSAANFCVLSVARSRPLGARVTTSVLVVPRAAATRAALNAMIPVKTKSCFVAQSATVSMTNLLMLCDVLRKVVA